MSSTKEPASSKRASFPREAACEKRFVKDWDRLSRSGRYNMKQLKEAMMLPIANDAPLARNGWTIPSRATGATIANVISAATSS